MSAPNPIADDRCEVAVVGAGPAGLSAAILFAGLGFSTVLVAPTSRPDDVRTTALLGGSRDFLKALGVWEAIAAAGCGLEAMRIVDDTGRLLRAPEVLFSARELGLDAFGVNIANADLTAILDTRARNAAGLRRIEAMVGAVAAGAGAIDLRLDGGGSLAARLVVAADGRGSPMRRAAGIDTREWALPQSALVLNFAHGKPHDGVSTEFHARHGPFVLVPLPGGDRSSAVLIDTPETVAALAALNDDTLAREAERRAHSILGAMRVVSERRIWPLSSLIAARCGRDRIALVGEAAHAFPPIGAQGLNLSLRDIADLAEVVVAARRQGEDIGGDGVMRAHERARRLDVETRTRGVDLINRTLLSDGLPAQAVRAVGLHLALRIGGLRRQMMREGLGPTVAAPRLMRGLDLDGFGVASAQKAVGSRPWVTR
ncbi:UbiH/UbiF family hydroxylase [Siculibacillus lacustris]|uniref:UbiH/UbiF family hydroxylase n=1 Tax=Siculibacillus lacustris TaxID=1549641 RepID=A0A4Q9VSF0_9HYPH|nr:UbiH/UbiF family hydroxylase [Siculibacillus lacustris]TBW37968.1 UbiH/UbiF family hydroxylase [Siculibacillus lacustris]